MAFIKVALSDAKESDVVPEGEYDLRIVKAEDKDSKAGNPMTVVMIQIVSEEYPNASPLNHFITYPSDNGSEGGNAMKLRDIARFLQVFSIPHTEDGFDTDDLQGAEGNCYLVQEEGQDKNGKANGMIFNRLNLPRLDTEEEKKPAARSGSRASSSRRR